MNKSEEFRERMKALLGNPATRHLIARLSDDEWLLFIDAVLGSLSGDLMERGESDPRCGLARAFRDARLPR